MLNLGKKMSFGVDVDDVWRYTGKKEPKSIILPHLLSIELPQGNILERMEEQFVLGRGDAQPSSEVDISVDYLADSAQELGVDFVRCWFPWRFLEPDPIDDAKLNELERGEGDYPEYPFDRMVKALEKRNIEVIPVLACGYSRMLPEGLNPDKDPSDYIRRAAIHAAAMVRHYRGEVSVWQIENEPNWWEMHAVGGWRRGAVWLEGGNFRTELLRVLNETVHREDPGAQTMVNLEADSGSLDVQYYASLCDIVGLDFYPNYKTSSPVDATPIANATTVFKQCGKPVIIAETGYPSGPQLLGYTETKQAEYIRMACVRAVEAVGVTAMGIWRFMDSPWRSFPDQENHFGLIDSRGRRKPSFSIYKDTIAEVRKLDL